MSRRTTASTSSGSREPKLRPCREIIQQLRWDPRYDLEAYDIHYEERFAGMRTISLASFLAKSEIPWHRIRQISLRSPNPDEPSQLVWDRDQRIDRISNTPPPASSSPQQDPNDASYLPTIEAEPTYHSALVVIPPASVWEPIQAIRREHDSSFHRWMPHINLLYGFVPAEDLPDAAELIELLIEAHELPSFTITFRQISAFSHRRSSTLWLQPEFTEDPDSASDDGHQTGLLHRLQAAFLPHFPRCDEQARKSGDGYTPHLTIAKIPRGQTPSAAQLQQTLQRSWQPISFPVDHVHLIHRHGDQPFQIKHSIPLRSGTSHKLPPGPARTGITAPAEGTQEPPQQASKATARDIVVPLKGLALVAFEAIEQAWAALLDDKGWHWLCEGETAESLQAHTLLWYGSHAIGIAGPDSDLDLLALVPEDIPPQGVFEALVERLGRDRSDLSWRIVDDALLPALKLSLDGVDVELTCARLPLGIWGHSIATWRPALPTLAETDSRALQGVIDATTLLDLLKKGHTEERFRALARALKEWSHRRGLSSTAAGYIGGFGWSIIAAWWCLKAAPTPPEAPSQPQGRAAETCAAQTCADLTALFGELAAWGGDEPIAASSEPLTGWRRHPKRDRLPIMTLCAPVHNIARTVTASTEAVLRAEWRRAHGLLTQLAQGAQTEPPMQRRWSDITEPVSPVDHPLCVQLSVGRSDAEEGSEAAPASQADTIQAACEGWLKGQFVSFLLHMEGRGSTLPWVSLRPYPGGEGTPWQLGIGQPEQTLKPQQIRRIEAATAATEAWLQDRWQRWADRPKGYEVVVAVG